MMPGSFPLAAAHNTCTNVPFQACGRFQTRINSAISLRKGTARWNDGGASLGFLSEIDTKAALENCSIF